GICPVAALPPDDFVAAPPVVPVPVVPLQLHGPPAQGDLGEGVDGADERPGAVGVGVGVGDARVVVVGGVGRPGVGRHVGRGEAVGPWHRPAENRGRLGHGAVGGGGGPGAAPLRRRGGGAGGGGLAGGRGGGAGGGGAAGGGMRRWEWRARDNRRRPRPTPGTPGTSRNTSSRWAWSATEPVTWT